MSVLWTTGLGSCVVLALGIWAVLAAVYGSKDQ